MKNIGKNLALLLACIITLSVFGLPVLAKDVDNTKFHYPITTDDVRWSEFESKQEMVDACKIPDEILSKMTSEELVDAVLDYPLIVNLHLYDNYDLGIDAIAKESDAFRELLTRPDAGTMLAKRLNSSNIELKLMNESENELSKFDKLTLSILLSENSIWSNVKDKNTTLDTLESLNTLSGDYVRTPNGTKVPVIKRGELLDSQEKEKIEEKEKKSYPNATFLRGATSNYNCHSYAWYSTSSRNKYWMDDPSAYMSDGSYSRVISPMDAKKGTKMYYDDGKHSAIVYKAGGPVRDANRLTVTSKWGKGQLVRHVANYSPYDSDNVTLWD